MRYILLTTALIPLGLCEGITPYCQTPVRPKVQEVKVNSQELKCLATTIYGEARGESHFGQVAVAYTLVNRAVNSTICKVALAPYQYSIYNDNPELRQAAMSLRVIPTGMNVIDKAAWKKSFEIAKAVLQKTIPDPTNGATHYLSPVAMKALHYQYPTWSHQFELVAVIENHQFYRAKI